jgi:hypothetical protein
MVNLISEHLNELEQLCLRFHVKRLDLFGSAINEKVFDPQKSDVDFLVEFLPLQPGEHTDSYFGLLEAIEELLSCHIDLVMPKAIKNPYFLESINKNREVLYAA